MSQTRIAIHGAAGRMGQRLVALAQSDPELSVVAALDAPSHRRLGEDAGVVAGIGPIGVRLGATLETPVDVVIDFSVPQAAESIVSRCVADIIPLVMATTGLDAVQTAADRRRRPEDPPGVVAQHESRRESHHETGGNGGASPP